MSAIGHLPRLVMLQGKLPQESKGIDHWPLPLMKYQNPEPWNSSGPYPMAQESKISEIIVSFPHISDTPACLKEVM